MKNKRSPAELIFHLSPLKAPHYRPYSEVPYFQHYIQISINNNQYILAKSLSPHVIFVKLPIVGFYIY